MPDAGLVWKQVLQPADRHEKIKAVRLVMEPLDKLAQLVL
jgi:hypothetical protein